MEAAFNSIRLGESNHMNKNLLAAAIAATCALGAVHTHAGAEEKAKNQTLGDLSCLENQIAGFDGELWACTDTPSGGGPAYEFVDGDGNILGDVVYIEDNKHAFGYFDDLSTVSIIKVTAPIDKAGWIFSGNFVRLQPGVYYRDDACIGTAYARPEYSTEPVYLLDFLVTDPFFYLPWANNATWTEFILSDVPAPPGTNDSAWYVKSSSAGDCNIGGNANSDDSLREVSFGNDFVLPPTPIFIVQKP